MRFVTMPSRAAWPCGDASPQPENGLKTSVAYISLGSKKQFVTRKEKEFGHKVEEA